MNEAAFFNVDNTLINIESMFDFYHYWTEITGNKDNSNIENFQKDMADNIPRTIVNEKYYQQFQGQTLESLNDKANKWFEDLFRKQQPLIHKTIERLYLHKKVNHKIIFVSSSMISLLKPFAKYLGANDILCTTLEIENGILTGNILPPQIIGEGKQIAIKQYAEVNNINLERSFAYGNDISDIPMLETVGNAVCVYPKADLLIYAKEKSWEIL